MSNISKHTEPQQPDSSAVISEEKKETSNGHILSKFDYDLYKEEDDISLPIVRVKRVSLPNKGERWKIFENNKVVFTLEGTKLTNKEKDFLRGVEGVTFLLAAAKKGIKSFNSLRIEIKKKLK